MVEAYQNCLPMVQLYGPAHVAPITSKVARLAAAEAHSGEASVGTRVGTVGTGCSRCGCLRGTRILCMSKGPGRQEEASAAGPEVGGKTQRPKAAGSLLILKLRENSPWSVGPRISRWVLTTRRSQGLDHSAGHWALGSQGLCFAQTMLC